MAALEFDDFLLPRIALAIALALLFAGSVRWARAARLAGGKILGGALWIPQGWLLVGISTLVGVGTPLSIFLPLALIAGIHLVIATVVLALVGLTLLWENDSVWSWKRHDPPEL